MSGPICDFVKNYAASGAIRMHMPGHKGRGPLQAELLDITEIAGADALYEASGIILESEKNAAKLFGTRATFYGTEGSSQMIRTMLYLAGLWAREKQRSKSGDRGADPRRVTILAARNVHKSFISAAALLDYDVEWVYGKEPSYLSCVITAEDLENSLKNSLKKTHRLPDAFFITSPDYLGKTADIRALKGVCRRYGVPFLVDNAHGAYLHFLNPARHPIDLGADMTCDSAHKTLPVLTGGAYLHVAKAEKTGAMAGEEETFYRKMAEFFAENARSGAALFGSTSPSYLILQSLDACNAYLHGGYREKLADFVRSLDGMKMRLKESGVPVLETEPLKVCIDARGIGGGTRLADELREAGIECEFADPDFVVLMPSPANTPEELKKLEEALKSTASAESKGREGEGAQSADFPDAAYGLERKRPEESDAKGSLCTPFCTEPERVLSIREAVLSPKETIPVSEAVGRIASSCTVSCPPAVPIVVSGERISKEAAAVFSYYGITEVEVVRS